MPVATSIGLPSPRRSERHAATRDRKQQQARLNKLVKPLTNSQKAISGALSKLRDDPYYDRARHTRGEIALGSVEDRLERAKKLKALVSARTKKDEAPAPDTDEGEKAQRKVDNAKDALHPWHARAWQRKIRPNQ